jgi:rhodanese-related sulfurtransferase
MKSNKGFYSLSIVVLLSLFGCSAQSQSKEKGTATVNQISQADFQKIVNTEKALIMDVRTPGEISSGIIKGASLFADFNSNEFASKVEKLDKSKAYIIYCRSGGRSNSAANYMVSKGFQKIYNLQGGISNWNGETTKP